jgi:Ca2+-binding RTX toxin-like protein
VTEVLEQRRMFATTLFDDGFGNLRLENDNAGHAMSLSTYAGNIFFYEDGKIKFQWSQAYAKSMTLNLNDGDDSFTVTSWTFSVATNAFGLTIDGGDGNDTLQGSYQIDSVFGGAGDDLVKSSRGPDLIDMGDGNDLYKPNGGKADVYGGAGVDTYDVSVLTMDGVNISLDDVDNDLDGYCSGNNIHSDIENIFTGGGRDLIVGSSAANTFKTGRGNDTIYAGDGDDTLYDSPGSDKLFGEGGNDTFISGKDEFVSNVPFVDSMYGGDGDDYFVGFNDAFKDIIDGGLGIDTVDGQGANDVLTNIEVVF